MKFSKKKYSKPAISVKHQQTNYSIVNQAIRVRVFLCLTLIVLLSCSKDDVPDTPATPTVKDIYACGIAYTSTSGNSIATYWKNGIATLLTDETQRSYAKAITVVGDDIYVAGGIKNDTKWVVTYWKNGIPTPLTEGTAEAITVIGNDIYVAGRNSNGSRSIATYWKNGVATPLTDGTESAYARAITVVDDDVYVAGELERDVAAYWKNGIATPLTNGDEEAYAHAITVVGDNVYVAGYVYNGSKYIATYWKNGVATSLTTQSGSFAHGIIVIDDDVYVAGHDGYIVTYWKNGVATPLSDGIQATRTTAMALVGDDVYVAGYGDNGSKYTAKLWKKGVITNIASDEISNSFAEGLFITTQ